MHRACRSQARNSKPKKRSSVMAFIFDRRRDRIRLTSCNGHDLGPSGLQIARPLREYPGRWSNDSPTVPQASATGPSDAIPAPGNPAQVRGNFAATGDTPGTGGANTTAAAVNAPTTAESASAGGAETNYLARFLGRYGANVTARWSVSGGLRRPPRAIATPCVRPRAAWSVSQCCGCRQGRGLPSSGPKWWRPTVSMLVLWS
jgi:hypothetical protein